MSKARAAEELISCLLTWLCIKSSGPPSVHTLSCIGLSEDGSGAVNVTVSWTLSGGDSADFYLINITTNAPETPYGGLLNITTASVTQHELTGFMAGYEYNITVCGVNCGSQEGSESEPLAIRPQGKHFLACFGTVNVTSYLNFKVKLLLQYACRLRFYTFWQVISSYDVLVAWML